MNTLEDLKRYTKGLVTGSTQEDVDAAEIALIPRIMFVQFLQENGDLGRMSKRFLQDAIHQVVSTGHHAYADFIKPLFKQILSVPENQRISPWRNHRLFGGIPYLNDEVFGRSLDEAVRINDKPLYQFICNFLPRYKWNVSTESEISIKRVVPIVGPWILGCVYERGVNQRETGTYFTPDDLCYHIARHSIEQWLLIRYGEKSGDPGPLLRVLSARSFRAQCNFSDSHPQLLSWIEQSLQNIRIVDLAIGGGAFLVAAIRVLLDLYQLTSLVRSRERPSNIGPALVKHILQENIYGMDISTHAVDLAKMRLWLLNRSLIRSSNSHSKHLLLPLENLVTGNALCVLSKRVANQQISMFDDPVNAIHDDRGVNGRIQSFLTQRGGFDVSIGNPPFVPLSQENQVQDKHAFIEAWNASNPKYKLKTTSDLSNFFILRGIETLCQDGVLVYITSRNFFDTIYGKPVREYLTQAVDLRYVFTLHNHPFTRPGMKAKANTVILSLSRRQPNDDTLHFSHLAHWNRSLCANMGRPIQRQELTFSDNWTETLFFDSTLRKELIACCTTKLSQYAHARMGAKTGCNSFFLLRKDREPFPGFFSGAPSNSLVPAVKNSRDILGFVLPKDTPFLLLNLYNRIPGVDGGYADSASEDVIVTYIREYANKSDRPADRLSVQGHHPEWYTLALPDPPTIAVQCIVDTHIGVFWNKDKVYATDQFQVIASSSDQELDGMLFLFLSSRIAHFFLEGKGLHRARFDGSFMLKIQVGHLNDLPCPDFHRLRIEIRKNLLGLMDDLVVIPDRKSESAQSLIDEIDKLFLKGFGYSDHESEVLQRKLKSALHEAIMFRWMKTRSRPNDNGEK